MKKICPNCNNKFECEENNQCWCMKLPDMSKTDEKTINCFCRNCLIQKFNENNNNKEH